MKVHFEKVDTTDEEHAIIYAMAETEDIRYAINLLEGNGGNIPVTKDGNTYLCSPQNIYYIESVDKKTFLYTKGDCYECKLRLYELEEMLSHYFIRCSKAMIVNLRKVKYVKSEMGGRMNASLLNGESIIISRSYVKDVKGRLGL